MKRKPLILALALLFVVSAALWGAKLVFRPPLSQADKKFRALTLGATNISYAIPVRGGGSPVIAGVSLEGGAIGGISAQELIQTLRFVDDPAVGYDKLSEASFLMTFFAVDGAELARFRVDQSTNSTTFFMRDAPQRQFKMHPRFEKLFLQRLESSSSSNRVKPQ